MSPPRPQKGSTLPRLSISRERAGESRGVRRADGPLLPRTVQDCPRREERQPFSVLFSPEVLLPSLLPMLSWRHLNPSSS